MKFQRGKMNNKEALGKGLYNIKNFKSEESFKDFFTPLRLRGNQFKWLAVCKFDHKIQPTYAIKDKLFFDKFPEIKKIQNE